MQSDNVKKGMQQAPHRSLFNALGFTKEEMDKPLIGIVSSYNEIVPGHMTLIDCQIDEDDKVFPMCSPGTPLQDTFDESDLKLKTDQ